MISHLSKLMTIIIIILNKTENTIKMRADKSVDPGSRISQSAFDPGDG